jgi:hypothetical protein
MWFEFRDRYDRLSFILAGGGGESILCEVGCFVLHGQSNVVFHVHLLLDYR